MHPTTEESMTFGRRVCALILAGALVALPASSAAAAAQGGGQISGTARAADGRALPGHTARLRAVNGGTVASATTGTAGQFTFAGVAPGEYLVEIVDAAGRVVASSAPVSLTAATAVIAGVAATAPAAGVAAGGFSLASFFTSSAGIITAGAIAGGITAGVVAARAPASPSR
jgi:hypothetical protein